MLGKRQLTVEDYIGILRRRKWFILIPAVIGPVLGYLACIVTPSQYTSQTLVLVEQPTVPENIVKSMVTADLNERLETMQEQILSRSRLEPIITEFGLYKKDASKAPMEELVGRLRKAIVVTPIAPENPNKDTPGFYVKVTFSDPHLAQQICTEVTSLFMQENLKLRQQQAEDTTDFLSKQLEDAKSKLDDQDGKLAAFKRQYIGALPEDEQTNLNLLMGLNSQLEATTQSLGRAQQDKTFAESELSQQTAAWQASQAGHDPQTLDKELADKENQLIDLRARYTDDHPDVIKLKNDIEHLKKQIASSPSETAQGAEKKPPQAAVEPQQIQQLRAQIHQHDQAIKQETAQQQEIQQQIKLYQGRVQLSPVVEQQYKELTRDYQTALDFYNDLLKKRSQSAMATDLERRQESEQFRVLDPANFPDRPSFPNKPTFVMGGFAGGLALGLGLAFLLEYKDASLRTERDVELMLRLPVLALIPEVEPLTVKGVKHAGPPLVAKPPVGEAHRA
jgi:polysaccharide chain length determinant protein (PEP-CTERM system associated)